MSTTVAGRRTDTIDRWGPATGDEEALDEVIGCSAQESCVRPFRRTGDPTLLMAAERFRHRIEPGW